MHVENPIWELIKKCGGPAPTKDCFPPLQASKSGGSWPPGDSCEWRVEGRDVPRVKAGVAGRREKDGENGIVKKCFPRERSKS